MADPSYRAAQPGEFFCPAGGKWYVTKHPLQNVRYWQDAPIALRNRYMCETGTRFVGCCLAEPCTNGCHGNTLRPAGRSMALDSQSPGGSCGGQTPFWTCGQAPTFWGCCNEDPCMNNSTCPDGKLEPTYWDRPDQYEYFKDLNILLSSTAPRPTSSPLPANLSSTSGSSRPSSAVIGGAVGGSLGFFAIVGFTFCLLWHRRKRSQTQANSDAASSMDQNKPEPGELASPVSAGTAPPTYSWNVSANSRHQRQWAHNYPEISGEDSKDSPRSPYAELHSKSSLGPIAELPGGPVANELDAPESAAKLSNPAFGNDMAKQTPILDHDSRAEPSKSAEKR
ncbi:hypothetical protein SVAN01_03026 [Stagonosporopsis vannaccii]|nr:hypothetical protein SVAN01_03026 [Stagonosporopsis vannaccii]